MNSLLCASVVLVVLFAPVALAEGPGYVGASFGVAQVDAKIDVFTLDESDAGWKLFGGYRFLRNFGIEGGYVDLGKAERSDPEISTETKGLNALGVGVIPLGRRFEVFGKAGFYLNESKLFNDGGFGNPDIREETNVNLTVGIGGAVTIGHVGFRLELEFFDIEETDTVFLASAGAEYRF